MPTGYYPNMDNDRDYAINETPKDEGEGGGTSNLHYPPPPFAKLGVLKGEKYK